MAKSDSNKGNPASKRIGNVAAKALRGVSWNKRQRAKTANKLAQAAAEKKNKALVAAGEKTPWQIACEKRAAGREAVRQKWLRQNPIGLIR